MLHCQEVGPLENYFLLNPNQFSQSPNGVKYLKEDKKRFNYDDEYNFSYSRRGIAVIINNDTFEDKSLSGRTGAENDTIKLELCFNNLGFDTRCGVNMTIFETEQVLKIVAHQMNREPNFDCFVLAISSHGDEIEETIRGTTTINSDVLHCTDGYKPINKILDIFSDENCPALAGKPRLCFIQACRGQKLDAGIKLNSPVSYEVVDNSKPNYANYQPAADKLVISPFPCMKDFLVMYATPPGYYAFRRIKEGSWFILALTKILGSIKNENCDLNKLLRQVVKEVAYGYQSSSKNTLITGKKQVPCIYSMLTKTVNLRPK